MSRPTWSYERDLWQKGFVAVAGVDEVGRGALAGPLVAAAIVVGSDPTKLSKFRGVKDSKQLTEKQREVLYKRILASVAAWSVVRIEAEEIDRLGIGVVNQRAMMQALEKLSVPTDFVLIDYMKLPWLGPSQAIVKGDEKVFSIAAASIVAKVTRDRLMHEYYKEFPQYGFQNHVGYGTPEHLQAIEKYGLTSLHRRSFMSAINV